MEEGEGGETSDATLTYEQEDDSELTLDYEQEEPVKDEAKIEKESSVHPPGVEEKEKEAVESKKRKLEDSSSEPPPSAKRTLSCAKKKNEPVMAEGQGDQQGKDGKETSVDGSSQSVNVKSAGGGAAAAKPSLEKKDSMEENLICQICQV